LAQDDLAADATGFGSGIEAVTSAKASDLRSVFGAGGTGAAADC
jgi:hypothetical protein